MNGQPDLLQIRAGAVRLVIKQALQDGEDDVAKRVEEVLRRELKELDVSRYVRQALDQSLRDFTRLAVDNAVRKACEDPEVTKRFRGTVRKAVRETVKEILEEFEDGD